MARPQSPPILTQLRSARTVPEQAAALRALKNDIVGHIQKKEQWVSLGVLDPIARTIIPDKPPPRLNGKGPHPQICSRPLTDDEEAKLQALQLIASFAHGGPAFLAPIHASQALAGILDNISPYHRPPQIIVAALRALIDIAEAASLADDYCALTTYALADTLFSPTHFDSLNAILSLTSPKHLFQTQVDLLCRLLSKLCRSDRHQAALAAAGVLDTLASRLASFAVADGCVIPGAQDAARNDGLMDAFPEPAAPTAKLEPVLEAVSAVVGDSRYRANQLIYSPAIMAVLPPIRFMPPTPEDVYPHIELRGADMTAMEYVLPSLPLQTINSVYSSPYSLGTRTRYNIWTGKRATSPGADPYGPRPAFDVVDMDEVESPLLPWLVHLVRCTRDGERLMAASLLAALYRAGLGSRHVRETSIALLVVPLLVDLISKHIPDVPTASAKDKAAQRAILQEAPLVLARFMVDCDVLQKAAVECQAVKVLTKLLRTAYAPVDTFTRPMWTPNPEGDVDMDADAPIAQLGGRGVHPALAHKIRLREASLKAITALAAGKEDYRKAFVAEDFVPYIVESLAEFPRKPHPPKDRSRDKNADNADNDDDAPATAPAPEYGKNSTAVIVAACHAVRMLSRSTSILRTALVDHGVAMPMFHFLQHRDLDVRNAATAAMANLVLEVSPVRELLTEKGVMAVLCQHTHSDQPSLRLNALWALKHLIVAVGPELKKACLEELGPGWLVQLIQDDTQQDDEDMYTSPPVVAEQPQQQGGHRWMYGRDGGLRELDGTGSWRTRQAEDKLRAVREAESQPTRRVRNDEVAIQEQGLDLIRNLIGIPGVGLGTEAGTETSDMIDHLFRELGQDRLFELLASKLRPRYVHALSRRAPTAGREARVLHPVPQVIVPAVYILVQMAGSDARHRQLVVAQTDLLRQLAQYSGRDKEVRIALCHLVTNLATHEDDDGDVEGGRARAAELKRLGFHDKMDEYRLEDRELDVRERAKLAVFHLDQAGLAPF